jgi:hypothetical protein
MLGFSNKALSGLLIALLFLPACGGSSSTSSPTITGIFLQSQPINQTAYSGQVAPQNQVSFTAYYLYSDLSVGKTPVAGVQWTGDGANWVSLAGNIATCLQPAPVILFPAFSTVSASAQVNGTVFKGDSGLYCF